jgi:adenosylhomocysteine/aminodeoxyfutalosine nucleosidase
MKIAIMGAMREEIEPLLDSLDSYKKIDYASNSYYEANYKGIDLVIAYSKIGKVYASLTATILIEKFKCEKLIFTGVAGGVNPKLKIGDLVLASCLCQHDVDITAFGHAHGYIPESPDRCIFPDKDLNQVALNVAKNRGINLIEGVIATGDQFIACDDKKCWIQDEFSADAIEMEGASVAVICESFRVPFAILRAISDTANMDASFDFDEFLKSSAKNSASFIIDILEELKD